VLAGGTRPPAVSPPVEDLDDPAPAPGPGRRRRVVAGAGALAAVIAAAGIGITLGSRTTGTDAEVIPAESPATTVTTVTPVGEVVVPGRLLEPTVWSGATDDAGNRAVLVGTRLEAPDPTVGVAVDWEWQQCPIDDQGAAPSARCEPIDDATGPTVTADDPAGGALRVIVDIDLDGVIVRAATPAVVVVTTLAPTTTTPPTPAPPSPPSGPAVPPSE
jgi:hypothetical protein